MKTVTVAIVEDSDEERSVLKGALARYSSEKQVLFEITCYERAEDFLVKTSDRVDILFMDIELPGGMDGMTAAEQFRTLNEATILIFVTNMRKYVIQGYHVGALNYILKPINYYGFAITLDRAMRQLSSRRSEVVKIRTSDGFKMIDCNNIFYVEIMKHDVRFFTTDGIITNYGTLNEWEKKLAPFNFVRCSSSSLVNLRHVSGVTGDEVTVGGVSLKVSRAKKKEFLQILTDYFGDTV